jgi:acyl carrier protein
MQAPNRWNRPIAVKEDGRFHLIASSASIFTGEAMDSLDDVIRWVRAELAVVFDRPVDEIDPAKSLARLGVDSATATHLMIGLEDVLKVELDPDVVAELLTIESLAAYAFGLARGPESNP